PAQRPALISGIEGLVPNDGTALSASLDLAAKSMNGRDRDGVIVMFVDGADGCGEDVCAVAQRIAQEQPRLRVNLVNISNNSLANCIADSTGGRVYSGDNAVQVAAALKQASQEVSSSNNCN
ncbi:vWA domain-containing protein, partial [Pseudomonas shirazensis]